MNLAFPNVFCRVFFLLDFLAKTSTRHTIAQTTHSITTSRVEMVIPAMTPTPRPVDCEIVLPPPLIGVVCGAVVIDGEEYTGEQEVGSVERRQEGKL